MSKVQRCAACRQEKPVSEMKVCMHNQMHRYVCDMKCMNAFYNPPKKAAPEAEPVEVVAHMYQHDETGLVGFVDQQQVDWGFEKNNPRLQLCGELMTVFQHNRIMASAPQHDAELVELLEAIAAAARGRESGYAARMHGDVVNGRCADSLVELLPRIDAKLATLSAKA